MRVATGQTHVSNGKLDASRLDDPHLAVEFAVKVRRPLNNSLLIGMTLIVEGFGVHIPKGYIYFAMGFSVFVELLNLRLRRKHDPVNLHERYAPEGEGATASDAE